MKYTTSEPLTVMEADLAPVLTEPAPVGSKRDRGANLVEYSLLLLLIMVAALLSLNLFSDATSQRFSTITSAMEGI